MLLPNALIIGVQKAGTTTLHNWLSQHPAIFGLNELKDFDFFSRYNDEKFIAAELGKYFKAANDNPIRLHSCVNYIFYKDALTRIKSLCPDAKLIVVLRDPVARALSAYNYFRKMQRETRDLGSALVYSPRANVTYTRENCDLTYLEHGYYFQQLSECFEIFPREQVLILDFDELKNKPEKVVHETFQFLGVSNDFTPDFQVKNKTGDVRFHFLQKGILKKNAVKRWFIKYFVNFWLPYYKRRRIKNMILEWNTKRDTIIQTMDTDVDRVRKLLNKLYRAENEKLDKLLGTSFSKKWGK